MSTAGRTRGAGGAVPHDRGGMLIPPEIPRTPFTWPQARTRGLSRHRLDELVAEGVVRRVLRNVYVRADAADSQLLRAQAARLVLSPFVVICDRTAAWIWGVDTFSSPSWRSFRLWRPTPCAGSSPGSRGPTS